MLGNTIMPLTASSVRCQSFDQFRIGHNIANNVMTNYLPFGGTVGKSEPSTSFILNTPPSKGVPTAKSIAGQTRNMTSSPTGRHSCLCMQRQLNCHTGDSPYLARHTPPEPHAIYPPGYPPAYRHTLCKGKANACSKASGVQVLSRSP